MTLYFAVFPMLFRFLGSGLPDMVQSDGFVMNTCLFAEGLAFSNCHALGKPTKLGGLAVRGQKQAPPSSKLAGPFLGLACHSGQVKLTLVCFNPCPSSLEQFRAHTLSSKKPKRGSQYHPHMILKGEPCAFPYHHTAPARSKSPRTRMARQTTRR